MLIISVSAWAEPMASPVDKLEQKWKAHIEPGDILLQDLDCPVRCELIREVTKSRYVHVGIVLLTNGERVVWEALHPVGPTPLAEWIERGEGGKVAIYRMKKSLRAQLPSIEREVKAMAGLEYDGDYQWDDERIYCSELVAKAVQRATGINLVKPHALGPGGLGPKKPVIQIMTHNRLTEETPFVSPKDLTKSKWLVKIVDELARQ
jgi:hypothetical protein